MKKLIEITPDGKEEMVPGNEPLKKDPKKKKLKDRWNDLKKALDHKKGIMDLEAEAEEDESEAPEGEQPQDSQQEPPM